MLETEPSAPALAVVVPAWNAAAFIGPCLDALLDAGFDAGEVTVVDDGSADGTLEIATRRGVKILTMSDSSGAAAARNAGAAAAKADVLVFVDSDVAVHRDVRRRLLGWFSRPDAPQAVFGSYDDDPERPEAVSRIRNLLHHHVHQTNAGDVPSFWTGLGAVRRDVFDSLQGFDPKVPMMEDIEFGMRLHAAGHRAVLDPHLRGKHWKHWSIRGLVRTDTWHRAVPWTKLLLSPAGRDFPQTLNVSSAGKASVIAVWLSSLVLPLIAVWPLGAAALLALCLGTVVVANRAFLAFVARLDGPWQALRALGVLWLHYLSAGFGYLLVRFGLA